MDINTLLALFQQLGLGQGGAQAKPYSPPQFGGGLMSGAPGAGTGMYTGGSPNFNEAGGGGPGTGVPPGIPGGYPGPVPPSPPAVPPPAPKPYIPPTIPGGYPGPTPIGQPPMQGIGPTPLTPPLDSSGALGTTMGQSPVIPQQGESDAMAQIRAILGSGSSLGQIMQGQGRMNRAY